MHPHAPAGMAVLEQFVGQLRFAVAGADPPCGPPFAPVEQAETCAAISANRPDRHLAVTVPPRPARPGPRRSWTLTAGVTSNRMWRTCNA